MTGSPISGPLALSVESETWPYAEPFSITGYTRHAATVVVVEVRGNGVTGRGEAAGVRYRDETAAGIVLQIEGCRAMLAEGISRQQLQTLLPAGGARNALDCALWDLEAKLAGRPVWQLLGENRPAPVVTSFTCGADSPEAMARVAKSYSGARILKLKLTGNCEDAERVLAVRAARPDVQLTIDANQGFSPGSLEALMPVLVRSRVTMIEQPFPIGGEALLDGNDWPIPIALDESVQDRSDLERVGRGVQTINIKLDKTGGLTEALALRAEARERGLNVMIGCMGSTSLGIAPAYQLAQGCDHADLDAPIFLAGDRPLSVRYSDGTAICPTALWGANQ